MKYIDYYPPVLKEIREINIIAESMDSELETINSSSEKVKNECFILTAEGVGLEKWEEAFNLSVSDIEDIELRRFNIIAKLMGNKIYLIDTLNNLIGEDGYSLRLWVMGLRLEVVLKLERKAYLKAVEDLLERIVPLNIELNITLAYNTHNVLSKYTHNQLSAYTHSQLIEKEGL